jgi:Sec-independent protein translocase protein TatA
MLALFESLGGMELVVVGIGALLLFGKDLPRVASEAGAQIGKLRRSLEGTWRDTGLEREVREIRDATRDLSLQSVARAASEKLAVRLDEVNEQSLSRPVPGPAPARVPDAGAAPEPIPGSVPVTGPGSVPASGAGEVPRQPARSGAADEQPAVPPAGIPPPPSG